MIRVPLAALSQRSAVLNNANLTPSGPTVALHVVGIEISEIEFPISTAPSDDLYTTQAPQSRVRLPSLGPQQERRGGAGGDPSRDHGHQVGEGERPEDHEHHGQDRH